MTDPVVTDGRLLADQLMEAGWPRIELPADMHRAMQVMLDACSNRMLAHLSLDFLEDIAHLAPPEVTAPQALVAMRAGVIAGKAAPLPAPWQRVIDEGRWYREFDEIGSKAISLINHALGGYWTPDRDPIGRRLIGHDAWTTSLDVSHLLGRVARLTFEREDPAPDQQRASATYTTAMFAHRKRQIRAAVTRMLRDGPMPPLPPLPRHEAWPRGAG